MKRYIAIDCGTTNCRLYFTEGETILKSLSYPTGIRDAIDDPTRLPSVIADGIRTLTDAYGQPEAILASGMITSEHGLCPLPHLPLPSGIAELHGGMKKVLLPEISLLPIRFIPGLRQVSEDYRSCDILRGEECELFGLTDAAGEDCLFVLPGSHCKHITVENGKITAFATFLTGELISAISGHTILKASLELSQDFEEEAVWEGYCHAAAHGVGAALFKVRVLDTLFEGSAAKCGGFFLGAILFDETRHIESAKQANVLLAGQPTLAKALAVILRRLGNKKVILADESLCTAANVRGMIRIFENRGSDGGALCSLQTKSD